MSARPLLLCVFLLLPTLPLVAAKKKSAPAPKSPAELATSATRFRLWKGDFPSKRAVHLTLRPTGKGANMDLGEFAPESHFGDYIPGVAGDCTMEARLSGETGAPLATFATRLPANASATLVLRETESGTLTFELLDDTPTGDDASGELFVRNFVPALKTLQLDAGPDLHLRLTTSSCFLHLRGLPRTSLQLETSGEDRTGAQIHWSNEVDFSQARRATLLIVTDPYGRIRPKIIIDASSPGAAPVTPALPTGEAR
jgi:hypothetical protein